MGLILADLFTVKFANRSLNKIFGRLDLYSHHIENKYKVFNENFGEEKLNNDFESVLMKKSVTMNRLPLTDTSPSKRCGTSPN
uniref:Uncharacterized protein n=1 Tax=Schistosoma mansoni TaxID=6183 RepID=A0A3Q0KT83_SCHMA